ncbi:MAG: alpha-amylase family protein, partial [Bacteroidota bacterium]
MVGAMAYADRFAGTLDGVRAQIPYLQELGITYLHLMPLFAAPDGPNDGGFAVSSYRDVAAHLGTTDDLRALADDLRAAGISLVLDFVFNHTSDEHTWAQQALAGDARYQSYYWLFPDRTEPDAYERHLREIFPEQAPGNFTWRPEVEQWVWTTFNRFQWDLNYRNPEVFLAMLEELLFIANLGAEVVRLDAIAFVWKQLGTNCEGLPQVHWIVQAYNALLAIAAPATVFKSEAIVHPAEVKSYVGVQEAPLSYNPTLMAMLWEALATRDTRLLRRSMEQHFGLPDGTAWVNYVRCHDDIGWTFANEDAADLGINAFEHRRFLNAFYTGHFPGSFARGLPFNYNPETQDMRISGMAASLIGVEEALQEGNERLLDDALARLELIHAVIYSAGGLPLVYLGDEIGMTNDYRYRRDPVTAGDSRFAHRPEFDWDRAAERETLGTIPHRLVHALARFAQLRAATPALGDTPTAFFHAGNDHVFTFRRGTPKTGLLTVVANLSEHGLAVPSPWLAHDGTDLLSGERVIAGMMLRLTPYQVRWVAEG